MLGENSGICSERSIGERMIYRLTVECIDGWYYDHETIRVIEIDEKAVLYDLFDIIREANIGGRP